MKIKGIEVSGHFKMICKKCGAIIAQCRCPSLDKTEYFAICDKCEKTDGSEQAGKA